MHEKEQRTTSSHTNYRYLTKEESSERLENLQKAKRALTRRNQQLKEKLHKIIDKDGLQLHDDDAASFARYSRMLILQSRAVLVDSFNSFSGNNSSGTTA